MFEDDRLLCKMLLTYICVLYKRLKYNRRLAASQAVQSKRTASNRTFWKQPGYFDIIFLPMKEKDNEEFFMNTRMTVSLFDSLLALVKTELSRTSLPKEISPEERLAITLLYLAKGVSHQHLVEIYKLDWVELARDIILETCEVLWRVLQPIYIRELSESEYKKIATNFNAKWHVPNCVGAISSKQIILNNSTESRRKQPMLIATCDHNYTFTSISFGKGGEFDSTPSGYAEMENVLSLPTIGVHAEDQLQVPYYFAGELALPLRNNLMRPYPGQAQNYQRQVFNYRLSRASQVIENALGIVTARWKILKKPINGKYEECKIIVLAAVALHNFIMLNDKKRLYCPENYADWEDEGHMLKAGGWRADTRCSCSALRSSKCFIRNANRLAFKFRSDLAEYFQNEGAVEFQEGAIKRLQKKSKKIYKYKKKSKIWPTEGGCGDTSQFCTT